MFTELSIFTVLLSLLLIFAIYLAIGLIWHLVEKKMTGRVTPNILHDFIAIIVATGVVLVVAIPV